MTHFKKIIMIVLLVAFAGIWGYLVYQVNANYPAAKNIAITEGEEGRYKGLRITPEGLENFRAAVRLKVGQFGFISSGRWLSTTTPDDTEQDLTAYINELLSISPEKFNELWGACPLVMKKYNILYDIVVNELGIDL